MDGGGPGRGGVTKIGSRKLLDRELIRGAAWRGGGFGWADERRDGTCPFALRFVPFFSYFFFFVL